MGMYDMVLVNCPNCGEEHEFQSKVGECFLMVYNLQSCPDDVLSNVNRHSPHHCDCGVSISVDVNSRKPVIISECVDTYWQRRCEAAEKLIGLEPSDPKTYDEFCRIRDEWGRIVNQEPK